MEKKRQEQRKNTEQNSSNFSDKKQQKKNHKSQKTTSLYIFRKEEHIVKQISKLSEVSKVKILSKLSLKELREYIETQLNYGQSFKFLIQRNTQNPVYEKYKEQNKKAEIKLDYSDNSPTKVIYQENKNKKNNTFINIDNQEEQLESKLNLQNQDNTLDFQQYQDNQLSFDITQHNLKNFIKSNTILLNSQNNIADTNEANIILQNQLLMSAKKQRTPKKFVQFEPLDENFINNNLNNNSSMITKNISTFKNIYNNYENNIEKEENIKRQLIGANQNINQSQNYQSKFMVHQDAFYLSSLDYRNIFKLNYNEEEKQKSSFAERIVQEQEHFIYFDQNNLQNQGKEPNLILQSQSSKFHYIDSGIPESLIENYQDICQKYNEGYMVIIKVDTCKHCLREVYQKKEVDLDEFIYNQNVHKEKKKRYMNPKIEHFKLDPFNAKLKANQLGLKNYQFCVTNEHLYIDEFDFLNSENKELIYLGVGFPLFFEFIKQCGFVLFALLLTSGSYNYLSNSLGSDCTDQTIQEQIQNNEQNINYCENDWITHFSLANKSQMLNLNYLQDMLNLFSIFCFVVIFQYLRNQQRQIINDYELLRTDDQHNYTILLENIHFKTGKNRLNQIRQIFQENCYQFIPQIKDITEYEFNPDLIKKNSFAGKNSFNTGTWVFVSLSNKVAKEQILVQKAGIFEFIFRFFRKRQIFVKLGNGKYQKLVPTQRKKIIFNGQTGYISNPPHPQNVIWENLHYKSSNILMRNIIIYTAIILMTVISFFLVYYLTSLYNLYYEWYIDQNSTYNQNYQSANFTSYNTTTSDNIQYNMKNNTQYIQHNDFHFLEASSSLQFSQKTQKYLQQQNQDPSFSFQLENTLIHQAVMLSILGLGELLDYILYLLTFFQKHKNQPQFNISLSWKNSFSWFWQIGLQLFIIQVVVVYFNYPSGFNQAIQYVRQTIVQPSGLLYLINSMFRANAIIKPLLYLFELKPIPVLGRTPLYWKKINIWRITKFGKKQSNYTKQEIKELREHYSRNVYEIADRYAYIVNTMFMTAFYAPLFPFSIFYSLFSLLIMYYIERYKIQKHNYVDRQVSSRLSLENLELLKWFLIFFCLGNFIFQYILVQEQEEVEYHDDLKNLEQYLKTNPDQNNVFLPNSSLIGIFFGLLYSIIPSSYINDKLFNVSSLHQPKSYQNGFEYQVPYDEAIREKNDDENFYIDQSYNLQENKDNKKNIPNDQAKYVDTKIKETEIDDYTMISTQYRDGIAIYIKIDVCSVCLREIQEIKKDQSEYQDKSNPLIQTKNKKNKHIQLMERDMVEAKKLARSKNLQNLQFCSKQGHWYIEKHILQEKKNGDIVKLYPINKREIQYNGVKSSISSPPHPQEIKWENLHIGFSNIIMRNHLQNNNQSMNNNNNNQTFAQTENDSFLEDFQEQLKYLYKIVTYNLKYYYTQIQDQIIQQIIMLLIILIVELFDYILYIVAVFRGYTTHLEQNIILSKYNSFSWFWSIGFQLFLIQIIVYYFDFFEKGFNYALQVVRQNIISNGGLLYLINSMFIANTITKPLLYLFDLKPIPWLAFGMLFVPIQYLNEKLFPILPQENPNYVPEYQDVKKLFRFTYKSENPQKQNNYFQK
ncbi:hypothetical protein PPERSA_09645 [Pseudocohnilembus persalinus]|uniref:Transmembrane protein n=1 Tax=Pseudocohnilembus persalinus TaxID=266149 RepID=A0A0V0QFR2_PSEPJ|nr:hypothetical protein PPERSA_09645 [Pseudocohnilembus persalinus]|eukprot:KRX01039.1 hypothetical protein PPERSA_09645 [Pseudocohnilembus persalinus]